jgi:hypothetical protein
MITPKELVAEYPCLSCRAGPGFECYGSYTTRRYPHKTRFVLALRERKNAERRAD